MSKVVKAKTEKLMIPQMWVTYHIGIAFDEIVCGGRPKVEGLAKSWLSQKYQDEVLRDKEFEKIQEKIIEMGGDLPPELEESSSRTFWTDPQGRYCLGNYMIKAMLKEAANILKITTTVKGSKNAICHGLFVYPQWIPLMVEGKPATKLEKYEVCGQVVGAKGPRHILTVFDCIRGATADFSIKISRPLYTSLKVQKDPNAEGIGVFLEEHLLPCLSLGSQIGLGASRSRSKGTFSITSIEREV